MPTLNEVWEQALQINANLVIVHNDLTQIQANADAWFRDIRGVLAGGLASLSSGLAGLQQRQDITNDLLVLATQQNETVICALEKVSRYTCAIQNSLAEETLLQRQIAGDTAGVVRMFGTTHPSAALELARAIEERERLERCCPPAPAVPPCMDQACPEPRTFVPRAPERYPVYEAPAPVDGREIG